MLFDTEFDFSKLPPSGQIRLSFSDVQNEVRQSVIDGIREGRTPAKFLPTILAGQKPAGFTKKDFTALDKELAAKKYPPNESQIDAIKRGIESDDIYLVLGPPGTGKTTVILEWVKYFIKTEHKRVLVSSQNNKAVDNVLERLAEEEGISAIRAGNEAKVQENMKEYLFENRMKNFQSDMEKNVREKKDALDQIEKQLKEYIQFVKAGVGMLAEIEDAKKVLKRTTEQKTSELKSALTRAWLDWFSKKKKLEKLLQKIHSTEAWIVDPKKHPFLRWLLTPFRKGKKKKLAKLLSDYDQMYPSYVKSIQTFNYIYHEIRAFELDESLLDLAEDVCVAEGEWEEHEKLLKTPVDDSLVHPNMPWPKVGPEYSKSSLDTLAAEVQKRLSGFS